MDAVTFRGNVASRRIHAGRRASWRIFALCWLGYLLVLAAWSAPTTGGDEVQPQPEQGIKAAFIYKFLGYVEWRPGTFARPASPIVIGVLGADGIADALHALVGGRRVGERPIDVRRVQPANALDGVHVLFIGRAESSRLAQLAPAAQRRGVLLVTDHEGALDDGSAINLLVIENRVRFEVSLDATERSGLKLSSRLLAVALWVRPPH
jgi:hypothetical protein